MRRELLRYLHQPLYWVVASAGLAVRIMMAWLDKLHRLEVFWTLSVDFWKKIGSVTEGFLILLVLVHPFSMDREDRVQPVVTSAAHGRGRLFCERLTAGTAATGIGVFLLALGNLIITVIFGTGLPYSEEWIKEFLSSSVIVFAGSVGFFLFCACVCDITQNQPVTMCICGFPYAISYFINSDMIHPPEPLWFCRYGFFSELVRGRPLRIMPAFWRGWYSALLIGVLILTIKKRKERKEL